MALRKHIFGKRAMLNLPGYEYGAIVAECIQTRYGWETKLCISDCSRTVVMSLHDPFADETSDEDFENDMHKLSTIIDCCKTLQRDLRTLRRRALR